MQGEWPVYLGHDQSEEVALAELEDSTNTWCIFRVPYSSVFTVL